VVVVASWLLEREYRQHRALDAELPATYRKWMASLDKHLQQGADEEKRRIIKMVVHPAEIENWARHAGRQVNEQTRSDFVVLMWQKGEDHRRAGIRRTPIGTFAKHQKRGLRPGVANGGLQADAG
jgi:hypothetical protein